MTNEVKITNKKKVRNYMDGISYEVTPLSCLKMVTASSIFGEPQYYADGEFSKKTIKDGDYYINPLVSEEVIISTEYENKKTSDVMENIIDNALDFNFKATLEWAIELRHRFNMRLNPQIILVRAALHPKRQEFNKKNPRFYRDVAMQVMKRGDEPASQLTYYLYLQKKKMGKRCKDNKKGLPSILKRSWKEKLEKLDEFEVNKYKNTHVGMLNTIKIVHAFNNNLNKLFVNIKDLKSRNKTWNVERSEGKTWKHIVSNNEKRKKKIPHMAMLFNMNKIFSEIDCIDEARDLLNIFKKGVGKNECYPFRYYQAHNVISENFEIHNQKLVLDTLEECMDLSLDNMPKLKGKTVCLSDNSGSCWRCFSSSQGINVIADINNLSSVITACMSDEGIVVKFGDNIKKTCVSRRRGVLYQASTIGANESSDVGGGTENGIWVFFEEAISQKIHYDNIFIYSDQQAGHGALYGLDYRTYKDYSTYERPRYFDVNKMISTYRKKVNPNVNVFSVQTAGYNNILIPEYLYRTTFLYGWTGKEAIFANEIINQWDEISNFKVSNLK